MFISIISFGKYIWLAIIQHDRLIAWLVFSFFTGGIHPVQSSNPVGRNDAWSVFSFVAASWERRGADSIIYQGCLSLLCFVWRIYPAWNNSSGSSSQSIRQNDQNDHYFVTDEYFWLGGSNQNRPINWTKIDKWSVFLIFVEWGHKYIKDVYHYFVPFSECIRLTIIHQDRPIHATKTIHDQSLFLRGRGGGPKNNFWCYHFFLIIPKLLENNFMLDKVPILSPKEEGLKTNYWI